MASKVNNKAKKAKKASEIGAAGKKGIDILFDFFAALGLFGLYISSVIKTASVNFYKKRLRRYVFKIDALRLKFVKFLSKISREFMFKFYNFAKFFIDARNVIERGYNSHPDATKSKRYLFATKAFFKGVKNNFKIFVTIMNYAMPIIALSVFISLVSYIGTLKFAVGVEYNGEHIGYVENEAVFESAETKLQERMIYLEEDEAIDDIPKFTVRVVNDVPLKTDAEMTDTIIQSSEGDIVKATGLSVDGEFYGAVKDEETLKTQLDKILDKYRTNTEGEEVAFAKDVKTEPGLFLAKNIVDETEVMSKITKEEQKDVYYTVVEGDTPLIIAAKNDMKLDDLVSLNKDLLTNCLVGKQVLVKKSQSFMPVKVSRNETYTQEIPFSTTFSESSKLFKGQEQVSRNGINGKEIVSAKVEYVDGYEVGRTIISATRLNNPTDKIITKGTLDMPRFSGSGGKVSNSGLIWPARGGYISQRYGGRSGHNGIDYAYRGNGYGQPVGAAIAGRVTYAGTRGSYGRLVIIESPGGIQTWYAHCSKLLVSSGQTVAQGQQIANVGSTGRSTGNHLHFRVVVNGVQKNPLNYLP